MRWSGARRGRRRAGAMGGCAGLAGTFFFLLAVFFVFFTLFGGGFSFFAVEALWRFRVAVITRIHVTVGAWHYFANFKSVVLTICLPPGCNCFYVFCAENSLALHGPQDRVCCAG